MPKKTRQIQPIDLCEAMLVDFSLPVRARCWVAPVGDPEDVKLRIIPVPPEGKAQVGIGRATVRRVMLPYAVFDYAPRNWQEGNYLSLWLDTRGLTLWEVADEH